MTRKQTLIFIATLASVALFTADVSAAPGGNGNGNGNGYGYGFGNGNGNGHGNGHGNGNGNGGGAGGAPLPALGATLFGQAIVLGGMAIVWRRRQRRSTRG